MFLACRLGLYCAKMPQMPGPMLPAPLNAKP